MYIDKQQQQQQQQQPQQHQQQQQSDESFSISCRACSMFCRDLLLPGVKVLRIWEARPYTDLVVRCSIWDTRPLVLENAQSTC
jgi:hypothetical protein